MAFKILIVEDEPDFRIVLVEYLQLKGYEAKGIASVAEYQSLKDPDSYDLIILDRTLPDGDGLVILEAHRKRSESPVIILSSLGELDERVKGLEADADYYLVKPFKMLELLAIVSRYARRQKNQTPGQAYWSINRRQRALTSPCGLTMNLTNMELAFLNCFRDAEGVSISREDIVSQLGHQANVYDYRRLQTMVSRLRLKVKEAGMSELPLESIYGDGYTYKARLIALDA